MHPFLRTVKPTMGIKSGTDPIRLVQTISHGSPIRTKVIWARTLLVPFCNKKNPSPAKPSSSVPKNFMSRTGKSSTNRTVMSGFVGSDPEHKRAAEAVRELWEASRDEWKRGGRSGKELYDWMDAETRRHIFEPFFTTKEQGGIDQADPHHAVDVKVNLSRRFRICCVSKVHGASWSSFLRFGS